jgi:hypothetical protein
MAITTISFDPAGSPQLIAEQLFLAFRDPATWTNAIEATSLLGRIISDFASVQWSHEETAAAWRASSG